MASLDFDNPDLTEALLMKMEAKMIRKQLEDKVDDLQCTSLFLSELSAESIQKLITLMRPVKLDQASFSDIKAKILTHIKPRKRCIIAERAKFMSTKQNPNESLVTYLNQLKESSKFCDFDKLTGASAEEEMIIMRFVDGLYSATLRQKVLENLQILDFYKLNLDHVINVAQQFEMLTVTPIVPQSEVCRVEKQFYRPSNRTHKISNCKFCGMSHPYGKCPAYNKVCLKCGRKNHFMKVCPMKEVKEVTEEEGNVYHINGGRGATIKQVIIENQPLDMLIDSGSDASIISEKMWQKIGSPKLSRTNKILRQFDNTKIPLLGKCSVLLEFDGRFIPVEIMVTSVDKKYGLLGNEVVNYSFSILSVESKKTIGCLKNFSAKLELVANAKPAFYESRHLPLHMRKPVEEERGTSQTC